ncbi:MAG: hypothetical protein WBV36_00520 [Terriglobales bacterium]
MSPRGVFFCCLSLLVLPWLARNRRPMLWDEQTLISELRASGVL